MTIRDVLAYVDEVAENPFSVKLKVGWLNLVEADIQTQVLLLAPEGAVRYTDADLDVELIVPDAFAELYQWHMLRQLALAQEEFERANNYAAAFNTAYIAYQTYVARNINPGGGYAQKVAYYLSAYQIAVKHGYTGTEKEWLKTLQGEKGEDGASLLNLRQSVMSTEPDGENVWLATLPSGDVPLVVRNGSQGKIGPAGEPGADGVGISTISFVGEAENGNGNVYKILLTNKSAYTFVAPRGPIGPQGEQAPPGLPEVDDDGYLAWSDEAADPGEPGSPGVGIAEIYQASSSDASGGENVWRVVLTDNSQSDFVVRNGRAGEDGTPGAAGKNGVGIARIETTESAVSGGANTVTIVLDDANETKKSFSVLNGKDGAPGGDQTPYTDHANMSRTIDGTRNYIEIFSYRIGYLLIYHIHVSAPSGQPFAVTTLGLNLPRAELSGASSIISAAGTDGSIGKISLENNSGVMTFSFSPPTSADADDYYGQWVGTLYSEDGSDIA